MTPVFETLQYSIELETLPDYESVCTRFINGFELFSTEKKQLVVSQILNEIIPNTRVKANPQFIDGILSRISYNALIEKQGIQLSLN